jgi:hypothetical protein
MRLPHEGWRLSRGRNQRESRKQGGAHIATWTHAGFLLGLFFNLDAWSDMFLRNVVDFQRITRRYIPGDKNLPPVPCFTGPARNLHKFLRDIVYQLSVWSAQNFQKIDQMPCKINTGGSGSLTSELYGLSGQLPELRKAPPIRIELGEPRSGMDLVQKGIISSSYRESNPDSSAVELIASR